MPYLTQEDRSEMEQEIGVSKIRRYFEKQDPKDAAGRINYLNTCLAIDQAKNHGRYWTFALFVGTLVCCILELYRTTISKYESKKEKENGEVR